MTNFESSPIWTIVVCCYNCTKTIEQTLNSIDLDDNRIVVMLIDDGSTDNIQEVLKPYLEKYPKTLFYHRKENGNQGSCINFALKRITTKYFSLLDSDDTYNIDCFKKLINVLSSIKEEVDLIRVCYNLIFSDRNKIKKVNISKTSKNYKIKDVDKLKIHSLPSIHSSIFVTSKLKNIKPLPEKKIFTDLILYENALVNTKNIAYIDKNICLYNYFIRPGQQTISLNKSCKKIGDLIYIYQELMNILPPDNSIYSKKQIVYFTMPIRYVLYWILQIEANDMMKSHSDKKKIIQECVQILQNFRNSNLLYKKYFKNLIIYLIHHRLNFILLAAKLSTWFCRSNYMAATKYSKPAKKQVKEQKNRYKESKKINKK